jgi:hypothetical protein
MVEEDLSGAGWLQGKKRRESGHCRRWDMVRSCVAFIGYNPIPYLPRGHSAPNPFVCD